MITSVVTISGYVTCVPRLVTTWNGQPELVLSVDVPSRPTDRDDNVHPPTHVRILVRGELARTVITSVTEGDFVTAHCGSISAYFTPGFQDTVDLPQITATARDMSVLLSDGEDTTLPHDAVLPADRAVRIVPATTKPGQDECLPCYLTRMLRGAGCLLTDPYRWTLLWREARPEDADQEELEHLVSALRQQARCDCEILGVFSCATASFASGLPSRRLCASPDLKVGDRTVCGRPNDGDGPDV